MRRLTFFTVLVAFVFSCGGQWPVLQGVAWANMVREYSEAVPFTQAVQMTFSGRYPCALCKAIAEKKNSEQRQRVLALEQHEKKILPVIAPVPLRAAFSVISYPELVVSFSGRHDSPPLPPPRAALI